MMRNLSEDEIEAVTGAIGTFVPTPFGWWDDWWKPRRPPRIDVDDI